MGAGRRAVVIVPWDAVPADSLERLLEEFVTRDGTDYGEREIPVTTRVEQVRVVLKRGDAVIWFDEATETISILTREAAQQAAAQ